MDHDKLLIERKQQCLSVLNCVILDVVRQIGIEPFSRGVRDEIENLSGMRDGTKIMAGWWYS